MLVSWLVLLFATNSFAISTIPPASIYDSNGGALDSLNGALNVNITGSSATQPVSGSLGRSWGLLNSTDSVDAVQSGAWSFTLLNSSVPVTGTFWQATQPVSGTFWQTTQPVSIATMPSTPVTGTFWQATQPVSLTSIPLATGAATDAELAIINSALGSPFQSGGSIGNTSFGISGTLPGFTSTPTFNLGTIGTASTAALQTTGNSILTLLHTSQTDGSEIVQNYPASATADFLAQGNITSGSGSTSFVSAACAGYTTAVFDITGTYVATIIAQGSIDAGATWFNLNYKSLSGAGIFTNTTANVPGSINVGGLSTIRIFATSFTSGTAVVKINVGMGGKYNQVASDAAGDLLATATQGPGGTSAWKVDGSAVTQPVSIASMPSTPVTGVFFQATQPVSIASMPTTPVTGAFFQSTQPVSIAGSNPCYYPGATLLSIAGATTTTNATQIIALSGSTKIYVCSLTVIGVSGTTPTFSLVQGTGSNCVTGQTTVVQAFGTTANQLYQFATPVAVGTAGAELCYKDGGTSPVQNYQVTYVQQ